MNLDGLSLDKLIDESGEINGTNGEGIIDKRKDKQVEKVLKKKYSPALSVFMRRVPKKKETENKEDPLYLVKTYLEKGNLDRLKDCSNDLSIDYNSVALFPLVQKKYHDFLLFDKLEMADSLKKITNVDIAERVIQDVYINYFARGNFEKIIALRNYSKIGFSEDTLNKAREVHTRRGTEIKLEHFLLSIDSLVDSNVSNAHKVYK